MLNEDVMKRLMDTFTIAIGFALVAVPALAGLPVKAPEPTSMALLAAGIGGVVWAKFRKWK